MKLGELQVFLGQVMLKIKTDKTKVHLADRNIP